MFLKSIHTEKLFELTLQRVTVNICLQYLFLYFYMLQV